MADSRERLALVRRWLLPELLCAGCSSNEAPLTEDADVAALLEARSDEASQTEPDRKEESAGDVADGGDIAPARVVESATLNGAPLDEPRLTPAQVVAGGEFVFVLSGN